jgi:prepilin-type N-terminal cleavage/methylation domain-containing protein
MNKGNSVNNYNWDRNNCNKLNRHHAGFTLIELLVVMVLLGLITSLLAPDMYSLLKRTQAKTELSKLRTLAQLSIERSFFSGSNLEIIFEENTVTINQLPDINAAEVTILKIITSEFFTFEDTIILISQGQWQGSKTVNLTKSPDDNLKQLVLLDEES